MPIAPTSSAELVDLIRRSGVAPPDKLAAVSDLSLPSNPQKAAAALVSQGVITRFQAQQLLAGKHKGFRIGAYVMLDLLGRGGMGAVYLAEHIELHRKVAIKVLVPGKDEDQRLALERFQREARAAAALDHPNIVRIFDVARFGETPYLVMEYVEGQTLQQILDKEGPIPYPTAAEYIAQAAAGLQHAFEKGFVHRDIKPGNLMRDKSGVVKLLDMGLARSSSAKDRLTEQLDQGSVVGTADFIAPEQGLNQSGVDIRADIYSLGATFFALIIGKPPFEGNTTQKLLQHQLRSAPTLASLDATLPSGLSAVVSKMLAKKPEDRYHTPAEVIAALAPWMGNSARVLAGLSRTNLAQGADLQATLSRIARNSSRRLRTGAQTANMQDSSEVDPSDASRETGAIPASATTRETKHRRKTKRRLQPTAMPRKKVILLASVGAVLLIAGAIVGWRAFGHAAPGADPDNRSRFDQERPKGNGNSPTSNLEREVFRLDAADLPSFRFTKEGRDMVTDGEDPTKIKGVGFIGWKKETISEWETSVIAGAKVVGFTNVNDTKSAQIGIDLEAANGVGLKFDAGAQLRLRVVYRTGGKGKGHIYFQSYGDWKVMDRVDLPNSNSAWKTVDLVVTRGDQPVRCLVDASEIGAGNTLYVRSVTVAELGKGGPPPATPAPKATPLTDVPADWIEGKTVYTLDVGAIPPYRVVKERFNRTSGDAEMLPVGFGCGAWKEKAVGEFRCEKVDDVPAFGLVNLNDEMSSQYFFQFEGEMKVQFEAGKGYRVKVGYMTKNEAKGSLNMQVTPGYKTIASTEMSNTDGKWKTVTLNFVRPPADDNVEVRMTIDNTSVGEGNLLWMRSVEIVEMVPPKK
jgi:serine/threonine protein kinase